MRALCVAISGAAYALIALSLALHAPWTAALAAGALGLGWMCLHALRPSSALHGSFFVLALAGAGFAASSSGAVLGLVIVCLALVGWDLGGVRRLLLHLPRRAEGRWGLRYALQSSAIGALGLALGLVGLLVRPRIGFPAALGLSLTIVTLLALALWQSGRFRGEPGSPSARDEDASDEGEPL